MIRDQTVVNYPTPGFRPSRLGTLRGVRREMARLYVDAREGREDAATAAKLTYVLQAVQKCLEVERLEERLDALERSNSHVA